MTYSSIFTSENNPTHTPQNQPIPGKEFKMSRNEAGGFTFTTPLKNRVLRFLIQGADGTYYASRRQMVLDNAKSVVELAQEDGVGLVDLIVEANTSRQLEDGSWQASAVGNKNPSIFALAVALKVGRGNGGDDVNIDTVRAVYNAIRSRKVISTLRQLEQFLNECYALEGSGQAHLDGKMKMGSGLKSAIYDWFNGRDNRWLAMQGLKYGSTNFRIGDPDRYILTDWNGNVTRDNRVQHKVTVRDILRKVHPKPANSTQNALYKWFTNRYSDKGLHRDEMNAILRESRDDSGAVDMMLAWDEAWHTDNVNTVIKAITEHGLTWEMINPQWFNNDNAKRRDKIWLTLLGVGDTRFNMPLNALVRHLPRISNYGLLENRDVRALLKETFSGDNTMEMLMKARVHPLTLLSAMRVHQKGEVERRGRITMKWRPDNALMGWLEDAYNMSFGTVTPIGNRVGHFYDTSGSMHSGEIGGVEGLTPFEAEACLSSVFSRIEDDFVSMAFTSGDWRNGITPVPITKHDSLDGIMSKMQQYTYHGGTDCALPFQWALNNKINLDTFIIFTDSETWAGRQHPDQALQEYRRRVNPNARVMFVAFTANKASLNDPDDLLSMEFVGFDASAPRVMNMFARGEL